MKMKKNILFMAMLTIFSTPVKPVDMSDMVGGCLVAGAVVVGIGAVGYLVLTAPYICPGCNGSIGDHESYVYGTSCTHRFHSHHYVAGTVCQQCLKDRYAKEALAKALNAAERDRQQAELTARQHAEYVRQQRDAERRAYDNAQQEKSRKIQQAWEIKRGEEEAQRVAQEESRKARGGYVTPAQAKADQQEEHGYRTAIEVAKEESRAKQQREAELATRRAQEQRAQDLNNRKKQEFDREQAAIKSTGWMMEECPICLAPRAQKGDVLINLKDPKHKTHTTALPCGHVFHTVCIKEAAKHDNRCPLCGTTFESNQL